MLGAVPAPSQEAMLARFAVSRDLLSYPLRLALILLGSQEGAGRWSGLVDAFRKTAARGGGA